MSDTFSSPLLDLIRGQNLIDDLQFEEVKEEHLRNGKAIGEILDDFGLIDTDTQLQIVANHLGTEVVSLSTRDFSPELLKIVPPDAARMYKCIPVEDMGSSVQIALADPLDPTTVDQLGFLTHRDIIPVVADPSDIEK